VSLFHLILVLSVVVVWGVNFVAVKTGLDGLTPAFLCFARFFFCLPAALFIKPPEAPLKKIALYSMVMFVFQFCLLFTGMRSGITPGLASALLQSQTFFAIAFGVLFLGEKFSVWQAAGAFVALCGIGLVAMHTGSEVTPGGLFYVMSAAVMWAAGSLIAKKMDRASGLSLVVWSSVLACPPLLLISLILDGPEAIRSSLQTIALRHVAAVGFIAYFSTLFGFGIWNGLLRHYPLSKLAPFTLLVPVVGMVSSHFMLGEPLHWWKITAAGMIIGGLLMHLAAARRNRLQIKAKG